MINLRKYVKAFTDTFGIAEDQVKALEYQSIVQWDSVGHMRLIAAVEDTFGIMMETDDIIDFSSFEKGKEILKKYNVVIE